MKEKRVLVVERSGSDISYSNETVTNNLGKQEESIVLTGIFTTFNQKNRNGRIYESADFLPHIEALKESCLTEEVNKMRCFARCTRAALRKVCKDYEEEIYGAHSTENGI